MTSVSCTTSSSIFASVTCDEVRDTIVNLINRTVAPKELNSFWA